MRYPRVFLHRYKRRYNRYTFAVGGVLRRVADWFDWMLPEEWNVEHNQWHHYALCEQTCNVLTSFF